MSKIQKQLVYQYRNASNQLPDFSQYYHFYITLHKAVLPEMQTAGRPLEDRMSARCWALW